MSAHDRYALAIALLDGDREARKILADLLEEQGDRGLAQWARSGSNSKHRRLDFALMLLPCRPGIELASEFIQQAFAARAGVQRRDRLASLVSQWCQATLGDEEFLADCQKFIGSMPHNWESHERHQSAVERLVEAIRCCIRADRCESGDCSNGSARHWKTMSLQHLRAVTKFCQDQAPTSHPSPDKLNWQIERTKSLLQRLLESGS